MTAVNSGQFVKICYFFLKGRHDLRVTGKRVYFKSMRETRFESGGVKTSEKITLTGECVCVCETDEQKDKFAQPEKPKGHK